MYEKDYEASVMSYFEQKIKSHELPSGLLSATPGNIKAECIKVCTNRFESKDEVIMEEFVQKKEDASSYIREISKPDTLTPYSVDKVHYTNYKGLIHFYTINGPHPLDTSRRLKPMSIHILEKYVYHTKH
ncbi:hypothetical protein LJ707_04855 [Mucilaginibacter sp. UR6-1]|uniref:hypothetical protein n=1 Tax=Mucilaginibacter sp. UR6-1 TaxID=1435643 RepID=UPI001E5BA11C|nr:hypothetical protein [Mucilaginibacter sp. UR6-1]MCC8408248.1 hypothetical protein [Mucilaginibacter sp. UR6-1]